LIFRGGHGFLLRENLFFLQIFAARLFFFVRCAVRIFFYAQCAVRKFILHFCIRHIGKNRGKIIFFILFVGKIIYFILFVSKIIFLKYYWGKIFFFIKNPCPPLKIKWSVPKQEAGKACCNIPRRIFGEITVLL